MKCFALCAVVCLATAAFGQVVTDLGLSDAPQNKRGLLIATLDGNTTGTVCNEVDFATAWITCLNLGWLFTTGTSTASELGGRVYTSLYEMGEREVVMVLGAVDSAAVSPKYHRGIDPPANSGDQAPIISDLACTGVATENGVTMFNCTFTDSTTECNSDNSNVAAITCYFTVGQIAGIVIGVFLFCLLITILPIVLCCICCCCCGCCAAAASRSG